MQYNTEDMIVLILCVMMMSIGILYLQRYNTRCCINAPQTDITPETPEEILETPVGYIHPIQEIPPLPT